MRLWHKDLIPVLPRQQLLGQWRECCLIAKQISEKGTPGHILVNRIMDYPIEHFHYYATRIHDEMWRRDYDCDFSKFEKWISLEKNHLPIYVHFEGWHNERYLKQCLYNLQEKFDCGGITQKEWQLIEFKMMQWGIEL